MRSQAQAIKPAPAARVAYRELCRAWQSGAALACSGGHDSTALLLLAVAARRVGAIGDFVVLHVDHATRSDSSADARFVAELCRATDTPCALHTLTWRAADARPSEEELRRRRYAALTRLTRSLGISAVVTAHTRDDQVETVLMRLMSGAAPLAAAGMRDAVTLPTDAGELRVLRPLLRVPRAALDAVLHEHAVVPRHDPSNDDTRFRRNALRRDVLPALRATFPGFEAALLRSTELAARDAAFIDAQAQAQLLASTTCVDGAVLLDRAWLRGAAPALATRVVRLALRALLDADAWRELTFERIEAVRLAADGRTGARIEVPGGVVATIERGNVVLRGRNREPGVDDAATVGEP